MERQGTAGGRAALGNTSDALGNTSDALGNTSDALGNTSDALGNTSDVYRAALGLEKSVEGGVC